MFFIKVGVNSISFSDRLKNGISWFLDKKLLFGDTYASIGERTDSNYPIGLLEGEAVLPEVPDGLFG